MANKFTEQITMSIKHLEEVISFDKMVFENYIVCREIPLDERWGVFEKAPECLKNKDTYGGIRFFDIGEHEDIVMYDGVVHAERYQYMDTVTCIESILFAIDEGDLVGYPLDDMKEKILQHNFGGFTYDW